MGKKAQPQGVQVWKQLLPAVGAATIAWAMAPQVHAAPTQVNINPIGDSITLGVDDTDTDIGGYRFYFNDLATERGLLAPNFIGNRSDGAGNHFADGGAQAQNDRDLSTDRPGLLRGIHNITADPTSNLAAFNPANGKADALFLHVGTNSVPGPTESSNSTGAFGLNNAFSSFQNLLLAGTPGVTAGVDGASFAPIADANGIHTQFNNPNVANAQSHVFVAGIIPLFESFSLQPSLLDTYNGIGQYNNQVKNFLDTDPTLNDPGSTVDYHYVDLFSITVDELDLDWLAGLFTGGDVNAVRALISPEAETGGTDFVDWGFGFTEENFDEGTLAALETSFTGFNDNLIGDGPGAFESGIHPTGLGYAVIANVFHNEAAAVLVPEPSSAALVLLGCSSLLVRRRRPTSAA